MNPHSLWIPRDSLLVQCVKRLPSALITTTTGTEVEAKVDTTTAATTRELAKGSIDELAPRYFSACVLLNFSVLSMPCSNLFVTDPAHFFEQHVRETEAERVRVSTPSALSPPPSP